MYMFLLPIWSDSYMIFNNSLYFLFFFAQAQLFVFSVFVEKYFSVIEIVIWIF